MRAAATSVELSSERFGVVAKIDVVEAEGDGVVPVDFKRGKVPAIDGGVYDPERVQLGLAAILLREAGYSCDVGRIYYAASRTYVDVPIDEALVAQTLLAVEGARQMRLRGTIPDPLVDSPKCGRCSLHAICLPDETNALKSAGQNDPVRPFAAPSDDEVPLYVLEPGARLGLSGEVLQVRTDSGVVADARLLEIASISLFGNVQISTQAMRAVLQRDVPVFFLSYGGWLNGYARSVNDHSLDLRIAQHELVKDEARSLEIARVRAWKGEKPAHHGSPVARQRCEGHPAGPVAAHASHRACAQRG
jgi:CRISPR-associated protein Cas1